LLTLSKTSFKNVAHDSAVDAKKKILMPLDFFDTKKYLDFFDTN